MGGWHGRPASDIIIFENFFTFLADSSRDNCCSPDELVFKLLSETILVDEAERMIGFLSFGERVLNIKPVLTTPFHNIQNKIPLFPLKIS